MMQKLTRASNANDACRRKPHQRICTEVFVVMAREILYYSLQTADSAPVGVGGFHAYAVPQPRESKGAR